MSKGLLQNTVDVSDMAEASELQNHISYTAIILQQPLILYTNVLYMDAGRLMPIIVFQFRARLPAFLGGNRTTPLKWAAGRRIDRRRQLAREVDAFALLGRIRVRHRDR